MSIISSSKEFLAAQQTASARGYSENRVLVSENREPVLEINPTNLVAKTRLINVNANAINFSDSELTDTSVEDENNQVSSFQPHLLPDEPHNVTLFFSNAPVTQDAKLPQRYQFSPRFGEGILTEFRDDKNQIKDLSPYLSAPIVITRIFEGEYGKAEEKLELAFFDSTTKRWRKFIIPREAIAKENSITVVNKYGYSVTHTKEHSEAKKLMRFLKEYEHQNHNIIPRSAMTEKIGFNDDFTDFALYSKQITIDPPGPEQKLLLEKGYVTKGNDLDYYIRSVRNIVKENSVPIFCYALSFASVLIKVLDAPSFSVEICRFSGYGKTVLQKLALGVWGNPKRLIRQWKTTIVGIESYLDFADGIITCLEDAHINKDDDNVTDGFFMVFNGTGKLRGAKQGGNRRTPTFSGILFSSTETESSHRINLDGIRRRLVELIVQAFPSKKEAQQAARSVEQLHDHCYGIAGKQWVDFIMGNLHLKDEWKYNYQEIINELDNDAEKAGFAEMDLDTAMDQNRLIAIVALSMQLMNTCFDFSFNTDKVIDDIKRMVYEQLTGNGKPLVALRSIISWAIINEKAHFSVDCKTGKQHGIIEPGEHIAFYADSVNYFLNKNTFNLSVIDEWKKLGILELEKDGKTNPKVSAGYNKRPRMMKFRWSELEKYCGEGFYDHDPINY